MEGEQGQIKRGISRLLRQWIRPKALLVFLIAFLLGRAAIGGQLVPFGIAFLVAVMIRSPHLLLPVAIMTIIGERSLGFVEPAWLTSFTFIVLILSRSFLATKGAGFIRQSIKAVLWIFTTKVLLFVVFLHPLAYDYLRLALEAMIAGALLPSYLIIVRVIQNPRDNFGKLQEEAGSIIFLFLGLLLGLNLTVAGYNLGAVISKYLVLMAAFGGPGWGAAIGAACGLIPGLAQFNGLVLTGLYSLSGMLAGLLKHWGKLGILAGFFCGNLFYSFYFSDHLFLTDFLKTSGLAAGLLVLTPKRILDYLSGRQSKSARQVKELPASIELGLKGLINLFEILSSRYMQTAAAIEEKQGRERVIKNTINKVCLDCPLSRYCWEEEGYLYYQYLSSWLEQLEMGRTEYPEEFMPPELKKRCKRPIELGTTLSYLLAVETANDLWQRKIVKERKATAAQLRSTIKILEKAHRDWEKISERDEAIEETLLLELEGLNLYPERLEVWVDEEQGTDIYLELKIQRQKGVNYAETIVKAFSANLNLPVTVKKQYFSGLDSIENLCLRLMVIKESKPEIGFAKLAKEGSEVSGDSLLVSGLSQNRWLFLLSDGMGSGEKAFQESSSLVLLLEQLLTLGFSLAEAIEMVNTLIFIEGDESFATIDLFLLDSDRELLEFIKIGAVPSLLITGGNCTILENSSIPVGVVEEITPETISRTLEPGAILIMVSDGVWQGAKNNNQEGWLPDFIKGVWQLEPNKLAHRILEHANILHGGKAEDDLTVLVAKITSE